jgi:hypothetical protein
MTGADEPPQGQSGSPDETAQKIGDIVQPTDVHATIVAASLGQLGNGALTCHPMGWSVAGRLDGGESPGGAEWMDTGRPLTASTIGRVPTGRFVRTSTR